MALHTPRGPDGCLLMSYETAKKRCDEATPGEWYPHEWGEEAFYVIVSDDDGSSVSLKIADINYGEKDADFIARARQDLPAALELIDALLLLLVDLRSEPTLTQMTITTAWRRFEALP